MRSFVFRATSRYRKRRQRVATSTRLWSPRPLRRIPRRSCRTRFSGSSLINKYYLIHRAIRTWARLSFKEPPSPPPARRWLRTRRRPAALARPGAAEVWRASSLPCRARPARRGGARAPRRQQGARSTGWECRYGCGRRLDETDRAAFGGFRRDVADRKARRAAGEAAVGDERARLAEPLRLQVARRIEHLLHARPAARALRSG